MNVESIRTAVSHTEARFSTTGAAYMGNLIDVDKSVKAELKIGGRACQCAECGLFFTGVKPFDRHQIWAGEGKRGNVVCLTPTEMLAAGMGRNIHGVWQYTSRTIEVETEKMAKSA